MSTRIRSLLTILLLSASAAMAQPKWQWAKKDGATSYVINPGYPRPVVAPGPDAKSLWGVLQNVKISYSGMSFGDYTMREMDSMGNSGPSFTVRGKLSLIKAESDAAGNWYVLGSFHDSVTLSSTMGLTRNATTGTGSEYFLFRLHAGTLAPDWIQLLGSDYYCRVTCMAMSSSALYVPLDSTNVTRICRHDLATGARTTLWSQAGRSNTASIQVDSPGNVYLMGHCMLGTALNFNGTVTTAPPSALYPWYIARYHANGSHHWHYYLTDVTCTPRSFKLGGNNAVYLSGPLSDSTTLAGYRFAKPTSMFNRDYLIARLDSNGSLMWAQQRPTSSMLLGNINFATPFHAAVIDTTLFIMFSTQGYSDWGNGITTTTNNHNLATIVAYSAASGTTLYAKSINGLTISGQQLMSDGYNLWVTGNGSDSTGLGFDTVSVPTSAGQYIPYVAKMNVKKQQTITPPPPPPPNAVKGPDAATSIRVWPNPANGYVMVDHLRGDETLTVRDMAGCAVTASISASGYAQRIETASLSRGIYMLEVQSASVSKVVRLVLR